jgi:hypothetical protein
MSSKRPGREPASARPGGPALSKKDQILSLFAGGITEVNDLAVITNSRPSYVAGVLQANNLMSGYFDLYTSTAQPMNLYSKFFANKLGFKDVDTARASVALIDHLYRQFETAGDRAGQHHSLVMALMMFDRARWTGKQEEAEVFRRWLADRLQEGAAATPVESSAAQQPLARRPSARKGGAGKNVPKEQALSSSPPGEEAAK